MTSDDREPAIHSGVTLLARLERQDWNGRIGPASANAAAGGEAASIDLWGRPSPPWPPRPRGRILSLQPFSVHCCTAMIISSIAMATIRLVIDSHTRAH